MHYLEITAGAALLMYLWTTIRVGLARGKFDIKAPAVSGDPEFERTFRAQQNTMEHMILFLPSLYLFATFQSEKTAAILGTVFIVGRVIYAITYSKAAEKRSAGFLIGFLATAALLIGGIAGALGF